MLREKACLRFRCTSNFYRFRGKKDAAKNLSIESDSSSLPSLGTADPISTMEKSNSDEDSAEKNLEPVINISTSNTDLSDDSGDSLTTR